MARRKVIGYNKAIELLKSGATIRWIPYSSCKAVIGDSTIRYNDYLKITRGGLVKIISPKHDTYTIYAWNADK